MELGSTKVLYWDTDDDDILYQLADPDASMDWSDQEGSVTNTDLSSNAADEGEGSDSQWDDPEWHKTHFPLLAYNLTM